MRTTFATLLLTLACCLALAACGGGAGKVGERAADDADQVLAEVNSFTAELMRKVETTPDPSAGLEEAQRTLDARRAELTSKITALKQSPALRSDDAARSRLLESEVENVHYVSTLRTKFMSETMRDKSFDGRLDRFVNDYKTLWRE